MTNPKTPLTMGQRRIHILLLGVILACVLLLAGDLVLTAQATPVPAAIPTTAQVMQESYTPDTADSSDYATPPPTPVVVFDDTRTHPWPPLMAEKQWRVHQWRTRQGLP